MSVFGEWDDDKIAKLKKFRAEGLSFGEISKRIKMSRNACIGKAERLKLPKLPKLTKSGGRKAPPKPKILPWNDPDPNDPEHEIDTRDLAILDALYAGETPAQVGKAFGLVESYVRELWRVREAQEPVGERA